MHCDKSIAHEFFLQGVLDRTRHCYFIVLYPPSSL